MIEVFYIILIKWKTHIGELEAQIKFIGQPFTSIKVISLPGVKFVLEFDSGVG